MMTAADVLGVLDALDPAGVEIWLDGGWGVDALVGVQTREHDDLDLVISAETADEAIAALARLGYAVDLDARPTRFVLTTPDHRRIDFHPVTFDGDGNAVQKGAGFHGGDASYPAAGFSGSGVIADHPVACLTPELLVLHHTGYRPADKDRHNVRLLCERFDIPPPEDYR
jgi:lincosamide nucleotidyltransferase A/C/D/E